MARGTSELREELDKLSPKEKDSKAVNKALRDYLASQERGAT